MQDYHNPLKPSLERRHFVKHATTGLLIAPLVLKSQATAIAAPRNTSVPFVDQRSNNANRQLSLFNTQTGEHFSANYFQNGRYNRRVLDHFHYLLRDHRENKTHPIDRQLIDLLYAVQQKFGGRELHIVSAYRTARTNAKLRRRTRGVAKNSYHTKGMAMDVRIPGIATKRIRNAAQSQRVGGVGWYPRSGFVHMDTGPVRYW